MTRTVPIDAEPYYQVEAFCHQTGRVDEMGAPVFDFQDRREVSAFLRWVKTDPARSALWRVSASSLRLSDHELVARASRVPWVWREV